MQAADDAKTAWTKPDPLADPNSIESRLRSRRFAHVAALIDQCLADRETIEILDLGGTEKYWLIAKDYLEKHRGRITITMVNNEEAPEPVDPMFQHRMGDACDPQLFAGRRFDLVHSNSVIEHVGDETMMQAFADTVARLSDAYFIQTPNYWFPLEPHFRVVGFQWLPLTARAALSRRFALGFFRQAASQEEAWNNVRDIRLLDKALMGRLFPDAELKIEKVAGLSKSIMAIKAPHRAS